MPSLHARTCTYIHTEDIGSIGTSSSINAVRHFFLSQQRAPDGSKALKQKNDFLRRVAHGCLIVPHRGC